MAWVKDGSYDTATLNLRRRKRVEGKQRYEKQAVPDGLIA
jgi:hypothetical protein